MATEALESSIREGKAGGWATSTSRGYYAILHAARAVLETKGITTKSHSGTHVLFHKHAVKSGEFDPEVAKVMVLGRKDRETADYNFQTGVGSSEAAEQRKRAMKFMRTAKKILRNAGLEINDGPEEAKELQDKAS